MYLSWKKIVETKNQTYNLSGYCAIIQQWQDPASNLYISKKLAYAQRVGIDCRHIITQDVDAMIIMLNNDPACIWLMVQLPAHANLDLIDPKKDMDCLTSANLWKITRSDYQIVPATVGAIMSLLYEYDIQICWSCIVVINNSALIWLPLVQVLSQAWWQVIMLDKHCPDLMPYLAIADIIISATPVAHIITQDMLRPHHVVIDAGYAYIDWVYYTNVDHTTADTYVCAITPKIGGVWPLTIYHVFHNLAILNSQ